MLHLEIKTSKFIFKVWLTLNSSRSAQSAYILVYEKKSLSEETEGIRRKVISKDLAGGFKNGRMELEEINLVSRLKSSEKHSIEEFQKEISQKNLKLFYIEKFLSPNYAHFLTGLIKNTEEIIGDSMEDKRFLSLFQFIWIAYVTTILRAPENSLQQKIFEWIYKKMDRVYIFTKLRFLIQ